MRTIFPTLLLAAACLIGTQAHAKPADEPYALVRDGQRTTFVGGHSSGDTDIDALKKQFSGNFVWFRQSGKSFIVRDAATLDKIAAAWAPAEKSGQEMKKFDADMRVQSNAMTALSRDMITAARGPNRGNTRALGKKMEALGKTMDALGKQMDALGKQLARESKQADATSRALVQAALANGAAQAVPQ
ncbi:MAG: hypothetical protein M3Y65_01340 [Pseudomonadota bacterium]|nr:hypothetical protein [Pseudomonadota bacterium]